MKFDVIFKENTTRKQLALIYKLHWKKVLRQNTLNLFLSIGSIVLGIYDVDNGGNYGFVLIIISFYGFFLYIKTLIKYFINKRKYTKNVNNLIEYYKQNYENSTIIEFDNDFIAFKNFESDLKLQWKEFSGFRIIDNNILFERINFPLQSIILGKDDIGEKQYIKLIDFIETKIKRTSH